MELNTDLAMYLTALALVVCSIASILRKTPVRQTVLRLLLVGYAGIIVAVTLFPIIIYVYPGDPIVDMGFNLIPFVRMVDTLSLSFSHNWKSLIPLIVFGGNLAMFIPMGMLLPAMFPRLKSAKKILLISLIVSCSIELCQCVEGLAIGILYRCIDIDDVILNTSGALIGYAIYKLVCVLINNHARAMQKK